MTGPQKDILVVSSVAIHYANLKRQGSISNALQSYDSHKQAVAKVFYFCYYSTFMMIII